MDAPDPKHQELEEETWKQRVFEKKNSVGSGEIQFKENLNLLILCFF